MKRADLITQLGAVAADLDAVVAPPATVADLETLCLTARLAFGAAAVSVASLRDEVLTYRAASGVGADIVVGSELPVSRGIAGYVALTGQSLVVDRPVDDPRFARDLAERTAYVPNTLLVVPVDAPGSGEVAGVLSVLDRSMASVDALELASAFARQAGRILGMLVSAIAAGSVVLEAVLSAIATGDADLAAALRRTIRPPQTSDVDVAQLAALVSSLRRVDESTRQRIIEVVGEIVELSTAGGPLRRPPR